jgi:hypothetical protein
MAKLSDDYSPLPPLDPQPARSQAEGASRAASTARSGAKPAGHGSEPARARMPIRRAEHADREAILESLRAGHTLAAAAAAGGLPPRALFNWRRHERALAPGGDLAALCRRVLAECAGAEDGDPPVGGEAVQEDEGEPGPRLPGEEPLRGLMPPSATASAEPIGRVSGWRGRPEEIRSVILCC